MNPMKEVLSECGSRHVCSVLLTGGIGSGKSAVASYLESKGVPVYDSDSRTKALYDSDPSLVPSLERALGVSLREEGGTFDRKALSSVIFSDKEALSKVESIVHPAVLEDFIRWKVECASRLCGGGHYGIPFVVMESAIALEKPLFKDVFDAVVMVTSPVAMRVERAVRRDGSDPSAVLSRIRNQRFDLMDADAVINNDLDKEELRWRTDLAMNIVQNKLSLQFRVR